MARDEPRSTSLLDPRLISHMREKGWTELRPIQEAAVHPILDGEDCILEAGTAGGKTEAVLFPALTLAAKSSGPGVRILYLAPLKALLNDLAVRAGKYAEACNLQSFMWHGDVSQKSKIDALEERPHLLLTTPESTEAILLRKSNWKDFFVHLEMVILDEAHNFAAGDRGGHLLSLLERISSVTGTNPQRIALSATVGNPDGLLGWLAGRDRPPGRHIAVPGTPKEKKFEVHYYPNLDHVDPAESSRAKQIGLLWRRLAGKRGLVFVPGRASAEALAKDLQAFDGTMPGPKLEVRTHHSSVSKFFREAAERLIKIRDETGVNAIVSTSTLELGIDIGELDIVVQAGKLASSSSFLQRVGRTGRREGKPQIFLGVCCDLESLRLLVASVSLGLRHEAESIHVPRRAFHLLAHQLICLSLQRHGVSQSEAWDCLHRPSCYSEIEREEFNALVEHMIDSGYLRVADGLLVAGEATEREFLGAGWRRLFAVFDTAPLYDVYHGKQQVGTLDAGFVDRNEEPFVFILGGMLWRAERIDERHRRIRAQPASEGEEPKWRGGGPGVPFETAQEVGRLLHFGETPDFLSQEAWKLWEDLRWDPTLTGWNQDRGALHQLGPGHYELMTFAGDRINLTLAGYLERRGISGLRSDYWRVVVKDDPEDDAVGARIETAIRDLARGDWSDPERLRKALCKNQPLRRFSPFATCLPPELHAAAMVEQSMDVEGLIALVRRASPGIFESRDLQAALGEIDVGSDGSGPERI